MLRQSDVLENKYTLGAKVAGIGLGDVDYVADTITLDSRAAELFDLPSGVAISRQTLHGRIHPQDRLVIDEQVAHLLDPDLENIIEVHHRVIHSDGEIRWLTARKQVEFDDGQDSRQPVPLAGLVAIIDVTSQKQDQLNAQFLLEELNHRSKNLLTVVESLARRTLASGDKDTFEQRFSDRLRGLVHNHDVLVKGDWKHADLTGLINAHLNGFVRRGSNRMSVAGPEAVLGEAAAQAIGMALHELATNAAKYGALSGSAGSVDVSWHLQNDPSASLVLTWSEAGGPLVALPERKGFGQKVLQDMAARSVNGHVVLEYRPTGVFWQISVPSSALG